MEPMILALQGADLNAVRALQQFIGQGTWSAQALVLEQQRLIAEWLGDSQGVVIVDGSGFPKQGDDSVGVARQYCGHLGKVANCQEGVFLVYASQHGYAFLDCRLYLHADWFADGHRERWLKCGIPKAPASKPSLLWQERCCKGWLRAA
jgi:SRSO17 transposase